MILLLFCSMDQLRIAEDNGGLLIGVRTDGNIEDGQIDLHRRHIAEACRAGACDHIALVDGIADTDECLA